MIKIRLVIYPRHAVAPLNKIISTTYLAIKFRSLISERSSNYSITIEQDD